MGLGQWFSKKPQRFVSDESHAANRAKQCTMAPQTIGQLRQLGVGPERQLKLEFFFYTDAADKAGALVADLAAMSYSVQSSSAAGDPRLQVVTGWTTPMLMNESMVVSWTQQMCDLGFTRDCEFDGWGTNPSQ